VVEVSNRRDEFGRFKRMFWGHWRGNGVVGAAGGCITCDDNAKGQAEWWQDIEKDLVEGSEKAKQELEIFFEKLRVLQVLEEEGYKRATTLTKRMNDTLPSSIKSPAERCQSTSSSGSSRMV
jgi:hypothetical protein